MLIPSPVLFSNPKEKKSITIGCFPCAFEMSPTLELSFDESKFITTKTVPLLDEIAWTSESVICTNPFEDICPALKIVIGDESRLPKCNSIEVSEKSEMPNSFSNDCKS